MVKKLELVQDICRMVGITRQDPRSGSFSKKELHAVFAHLHLEEQDRQLKSKQKRS